MARYGLGYEDLKKINPRIIFCSVTGYGQTGPKKSDPAIDGVIQAVSGMMSITGTPETGPLKSGSTIVDYTHGLRGRPRHRHRALPADAAPAKARRSTSPCWRRR